MAEISNKEMREALDEDERFAPIGDRGEYVLRDHERLIEDQVLGRLVAELMTAPAAGFILNGAFSRGQELMDLHQRGISYPMVER